MESPYQSPRGSFGSDKGVVQQLCGNIDDLSNHSEGDLLLSGSHSGIYSPEDGRSRTTSGASDHASVSHDTHAATKPRKTSPLENPLVVMALMAVTLGGVATYFVHSTDAKAHQSNEDNSSMTFNIAGDAITFAVLALNKYQSYLLANGNVIGTSTTRDKYAHMYTRPVLYVHLAYALAEITELSIGFGPPYNGADFREGATLFSAVHDQLSATFPDNSWQGRGAGAYSGQVATVQDAAADMTRNDQRLARLLTKHAGCVLHIRLGFGLLKFILAVAAAAASIAATYIAGPNMVAATYLAQAVTALGASAAIGMVTALRNISFTAVSDIDKLKSDYKKLASHVSHLAPAGLAVQAYGTAAPGTPAPQFDAVLADPLRPAIPSRPTRKGTGAVTPAAAHIPRPAPVADTATRTPARPRPPVLFEPASTAPGPTTQASPA